MYIILAALFNELVKPTLEENAPLAARCSNYLELRISGMQKCRQRYEYESGLTYCHKQMQSMKQNAYNV